LRSLAGYADRYGAGFHRIESLAEISGKTLILDLQDAAVREHVNRWDRSVAALYEKAGADPSWPAAGQAGLW
jgi:hypothetical protein